jgi:acetyltransferase
VDINPLLACWGESGTDAFVALDARVVLHALDAAPQRPAIRPYPSQYVSSWQFPDGAEVTIRPIRPDDEKLISHFHSRVSDQSARQSYFHMMSAAHRSSHARLIRTCFSDYDRDIALVVESNAAESEILAVGRLAKNRAGDEAELALLIADEFQGHGLGHELMRRLLEVARAENLVRVVVDILGENRRMVELCRDYGFRLEYAGAGIMHGVLDTVSAVLR